MKKKITLSLLVLFSWILFGCSDRINGGISDLKTEVSVVADDKTIYTSFYPIYFLTKSLIGDQAKIVNMVSAGWEPHEFEPSLKQIWDMWNADMLILNWLWMEQYEEKLLQRFWTWKVYLLAENLSNLMKLDQGDEHEHEKEHQHHWDTDPHTWLSPKVYYELGLILSKELESKWYNINKSILDELQRLDESYSSWLVGCKVKELVTSHKAFWYLARDYGLSQYAVFGISPEEEPSAKDIKDVVDMIKEKKLQYIFSEPFISQKFSETIKKETWAEVYLLHPLETLSDEEEKAWEDYISLMKKNLEKIIIWLQCK